MIWWLIAGVIGGAIGIANKILGNLKRKAAKERQRWENEYRTVERQVQQYDRQIQQKLREAQHTVDFHKLTNLHFESMKVADHAYSLLKDARVATDAIGMAIVEAAKEKNRLIAQKRSTSMWNQGRKNELEQEISALQQLGSQLYPDKDQLVKQRNDFYAQVKEFNARTHSLKLAINDRCGEQGRNWYKRLEVRTENRRRKASGQRLLVEPKKYNARPKPKKTRGTVKWFNTQKGFGFIAPDDGSKDVHVNKKNLKGMSSLQQNQRVEFEKMRGDRGPWARNVKSI